MLIHRMFAGELIFFLLFLQCEDNFFNSEIMEFVGTDKTYGCLVNRKSSIIRVVGKSYSVMDLVKMIDGDYIHIPPRLGESRHTLADISLAKSLLNWSPKVNLEDWLEENK